ncbi:Crp/Fnr family transcriptional regulator [Streptomyces sp. TRM72054]|nr:Crp/Fnr family transcriptional regulator [Streptomyces sp. TRM72054]
MAAGEPHGGPGERRRRAAAAGDGARVRGRGRDGHRGTAGLPCRAAPHRVREGRGAAGRRGSVLLAVRGPGDLVGEFAAIDGGPRSASVIAAGTVSVRTIGGAEFRAFLRERPQAAEAVQRSITAKLRSATRYRIDTGGGSVTARVARTLDTLVRMYGRADAGCVRIDLPLTQGDLAALAGVSQAGVQRALRQLRAADAVATEYRGTVVRDVTALRRAAGE